MLLVIFTCGSAVFDLLLLICNVKGDGAAGLGGAAGGVEDADYGDVGVERGEVVFWVQGATEDGR